MVLFWFCPIIVSNQKRQKQLQLNRYNCQRQKIGVTCWIFSTWLKYSMLALIDECVFNWFQNKKCLTDQPALLSTSSPAWLDSTNHSNLHTHSEFSTWMNVISLKFEAEMQVQNVNKQPLQKNDFWNTDAWISVTQVKQLFSVTVRFVVSGQKCWLLG